MEGYLSIREAAEKWGVSERRVYQYCAQGRIPGAMRFGGAWAIPENTEKPGDSRREGKPVANSRETSELFSNLMPLLNTPFAPGECLQAIREMESGPKKNIALAEYHYFTGQAEKTMKETERYLTVKDSAIRLSACWLYAFACLTMGRPDHAEGKTEITLDSTVLPALGHDYKDGVCTRCECKDPDYVPPSDPEAPAQTGESALLPLMAVLMIFSAAALLWTARKKQQF